MTKFSICRKSDFDTKWYKKWCKELNEIPRYHRKQWEHCVIVQILSERGLLKSGVKALGFAVGEEPLPALFAKNGVEVTATDIDPNTKTAKLWDNGQLLKNKSKLWKGIGDKKRFNALVSTRSVDMNSIPAEILNSSFDFNWSSCSFEHLGSIQKGVDFIIKQMETLKTGGWSVHTSELNLSSNSGTLETENLVIYRLKDIYKMINLLEGMNCKTERFIVKLGFSEDERFVDLPPYGQAPHLRLLLDRFVSTSFVLIIQKNQKFNKSARRVYRLIEYYCNLIILKLYYNFVLRLSLRRSLIDKR